MTEIIYITTGYIVGYLLTLFLLKTLWSRLNSKDPSLDYVDAVLWPITLSIGLALSIIIPCAIATTTAAESVRR